MVCGVLDCDLLEDPFPLLDTVLPTDPPPDIREGFSGAPPVDELTDCAALLLLLLLEPPHSTLVTRSITLVFSPDLLLPLLW